MNESNLYPVYHLHSADFLKAPLSGFLVTLAVIRPEGSATGWKTSAPPSRPRPLSRPNGARFTGLIDNKASVNVATINSRISGSHIMLVRVAVADLLDLLCVPQ